MSKLSIIIDRDGSIRHLNKDELNDMQLGAVEQIERTSNVEVFDDLPAEAKSVIAATYSSRDPEHHLQRFPGHRLQWWIWIIPLKMASGPYLTRTQALAHEVTLLQNRGLPLRERPADN